MASAFQYQYRDTPVHKLTPVTKLLLFGFFMTIGGIYLDPKITIPMLVALVTILRMAKFPFRAHSKVVLLAAIAFFIGQSYYAVLMVRAECFKVYPAEWVSRTIIELTPPDFPVIGRAALTYGGLLWWVARPISTVIVILGVAGLIYTTPLNEIVSVLVLCRMPFPLIFMSTAALRFVPELTERIRIIQRAQSLRGWTAETKNPIKRIMLLKPLLMPLTRYVVSSIDIMTMSSKNRAFGLGKVTPIHSFTFSTVDYIVSVSALLLIGVCFYLMFAFNFGTL